MLRLRGRDKTSLAFLQARHGRIPTCLELGGDESVVGIDLLVPTDSELDVVLGLLALELESAALLVDLGDRFALRHESSFHRERFNDKQNLGTDREVGPLCAEGDAGLDAVHLSPSSAGIPRLVIVARIRDVQHSPASSAPQETGEQPSAATCGLRGTGTLAEEVARETCSIALERFPGEQGLVMGAHNHGPQLQ